MALEPGDSDEGTLSIRGSGRVPSVAATGWGHGLSSFSRSELFRRFVMVVGSARTPNANS